MTDNIEAGAPEGLYSVKMAPPSPTPADGADRAADRLWLAGMAMQALIQARGNDMYNIAHQSWAMADAMLEVEGNA
jgi:hypothetical protein